jgi:toxin ParE1/3/4
LRAPVFKVRFLPTAEADLRILWYQIAEHNYYAADEWLEAVWNRAKSLSQFPERGSPRDDLLSGIRMLIEGKYLIFYRIENEEVEIVRVVHGAMDLPKIFS